MEIKTKFNIDDIVKLKEHDTVGIIASIQIISGTIITYNLVNEDYENDIGAFEEDELIKKGKL